MTTPTMLRTGNRVLDVANGLVFEKISNGNINAIVHVYRIDSGRGQPQNYVKYRDLAATSLWAHVCSQAVDLYNV